jgi:hypothetical protein
MIYTDRGGPAFTVSAFDGTPGSRLSRTRSRLRVNGCKYTKKTDEELRVVVYVEGYCILSTVGIWAALCASAACISAFWIH